LRAARESSRRWLLVIASSATVISILHHVEHVARGKRSGWPFQAEVTPFTFSLLIYVLILPGIYLIARGRDVAGYHLFVAVTGLALLGAVRFVPTGGQESPIHDIYILYESPVAGMLALVILAGLMPSALRTSRNSLSCTAQERSAGSCRDRLRVSKRLLRQQDCASRCVWCPKGRWRCGSLPRHGIGGRRITC